MANQAHDVNDANDPEAAAADDGARAQRSSREVVVDLVLRMAKAAGSVLAPSTYDDVGLADDFNRAPASPRTRLQLKRQAQTKTTEPHN